MESLLFLFFAMAFYSIHTVTSVMDNPFQQAARVHLSPYTYSHTSQYSFRAPFGSLSY